MKYLRSITKEEFKGAIKFGVEKGQINDPSEASLKDSVINFSGEIVIKNRNGKVIFNTKHENIIIKEEVFLKQLKEQSPKKNISEISSKQNVLVRFGPIFLTILLPILIITSCVSYLEDERKREEANFQRYINSLDYSNPVRFYENPNEIFDDIETNKYRFRNSVEGRIVQIKGYINDNFIQENYFVIEGYGTLLPPRVDCYPLKEDIPKMINLSAGQTVLITGVVEYSDSPWDTINLRFCKFNNRIRQSGSSNLSDFLKIFE